MSYGTLSAVKQILRITDASSDTELTSCQAGAYAEVDNILKFHGFTVPLGSPNQNVVDAENYWAAAYFREREDSVEAEKLYKRGKTFLEAYIDAEKNQPTLKRIGFWLSRLYGLTAQFSSLGLSENQNEQRKRCDTGRQRCSTTKQKTLSTL